MSRFFTRLFTKPLSNAKVRRIQNSTIQNGLLLRIISSTCSTRWPIDSIFARHLFSLDVFYQDQTSLDIARIDSTRLDSTRLDSTRLDSTRLDSTRLAQQVGQTTRFSISFFCRVKNQELYNFKTNGIRHAEYN